MIKKILYLDVKTTGLDHKKNAIIKLDTIIEINDNFIKKSSFNINPFSYNKKVYIDKNTFENNSYAKIKEATLHFPESQKTFFLFQKMLNNFVDKTIESDFFLISAYDINFCINFLREWFLDSKSDDFDKYFCY